MAFPVFLDTCCLFGQALCDVLLSLAERGCYAPYWSEDVLDAMERSVVERGHASPEAMRRRRAAMERAFPGAMVNGYRELVGSMLNHPGDRHVLAACVVSPAHTLVTFNVKDFRTDSLAPYDIEARHPDEFLLDQFDLHPVLMRDAIRQMLLRNRRPPQDVSVLVAYLRRSGVPKAASALQERLA